MRRPPQRLQRTVHCLDHLFTLTKILTLQTMVNVDDLTGRTRAPEEHSHKCKLYLTLSNMFRRRIRRTSRVCHLAKQATQWPQPTPNRSIVLERYKCLIFGATYSTYLSVDRPGWPGHTEQRDNSSNSAKGMCSFHPNHLLIMHPGTG